MTDDELRNWIDAYLTGEVSEVQAKALSDRLREDETARDLFLQMADTHACLAVDEALWTLAMLLTKVLTSWASMMCYYVLFPSNEWNYLSGIVRWVRFPKHISFFSTLSQLESVGLGNSSDWIQRVVRELVVETTV